MYKEAYHNHEISDEIKNDLANRLRLQNVNEIAVEIIKILMSRKTKLSTIKDIMKDYNIYLTK